MSVSNKKTRRAIFFTQTQNPPDYDWTVALLTLQGIVNRSGPNLLIDGHHLNDWGKADQLWRHIYTEQYCFQFDEVNTFEELVRRFHRKITGLVLYDADFDMTRFAAVTLGSLRQLLPVTTNLMESLQLNLPVVEDLRGRWKTSEQVLDWMLAELLPQCDRRYGFNAGHSHDDIEMGWDFGVVGALDYAVMRKGLVVNFSPAEGPGEFYERKVPGYPEEVRLLRKALNSLEAPAAVYGWAEPEWTFTEVVNQCGHYVMCGHESNLSFHRAVSTRVRRLKQVKPLEKLRLEDKNYIAFLTSEGDTPRLITSHFFGAWEDPGRGSIPINWGTNPLFPSEFPVLAEYFQRTATPNDFFFAGVGGCGYIFPDHMKDFQRFLEFAKPHFDRSDIHIIDVWQRSEASKERLAPFAEICGLDAILQLPDDAKGNVAWLPDGTPLIYQYKPIHYFNGDPDEIAERVRTVAAASPAPRFLILYNSPHHNAPSYYKQIVDRLDPNLFVPVRLDVMVNLIQQYRRTPSVMRSLRPFTL